MASEEVQVQNELKLWNKKKLSIKSGYNEISNFH